MRTYIPLLAWLTLPVVAHAADGMGAIRGAADPDAQIVVVNLDDGTVSGHMAGCDGRYIVDNLKPGRYRIQEGGPRHAPRTVSVVAGRVAEIDLAPTVKIACPGTDGGTGTSHAWRPA